MGLSIEKLCGYLPPCALQGVSIILLFSSAQVVVPIIGSNLNGRQAILIYEVTGTEARPLLGLTPFKDQKLCSWRVLTADRREKDAVVQKRTNELS